MRTDITAGRVNYAVDPRSVSWQLLADLAGPFRVAVESATRGTEPERTFHLLVRAAGHKYAGTCGKGELQRINSDTAADASNQDIVPAFDTAFREQCAVSSYSPIRRNSRARNRGSVHSVKVFRSSD